MKMRIKRQRRKLRGKYSGNCLSCNAKWSKCWYIASIDNQKEWENRLKVVVTPTTDEVCFQCWDAKIRTSPKRKIHFKTETLEQPAEPLLERTRMEMRTKRRSLNNDFEYTIVSSKKSKRSKRSHSSQLADYDEKENLRIQNFQEEINITISDNSSFDDDDDVIFEETNAVFLLSTAFGKIPTFYTNAPSDDVDIRTTTPVNIIQINEGENLEIQTVPNPDDGMFEEFENGKAKKRGAYYCGKCGKLKKGHVCDTPQMPQISQDLPSLVIAEDLPKISEDVHLPKIANMQLPAIQFV